MQLGAFWYQTTSTPNGLELHGADRVAASGGHAHNGSHPTARQHLLHVIHDLSIREERVLVDVRAAEPGQDLRFQRCLRAERELSEGFKWPAAGRLISLASTEKR